MKLMGNGSFTFSVNYAGLQTGVTAVGYLTPDLGLTYPDLPSPLNTLYQKLREIAVNGTTEAYSEPIES